MEDFIPLYYYLTDALFFGFGLICVLLLILYYFFSDELKRIVSLLLESITKLIRVVALVYFIITIANIFKKASLEDNFFTKENFFGSGSAFFWIKQVAIPLLLQLFWIPKVYRNKWLVFFLSFIAAFFFLILNERFIIMSTSLHRDYMPEGWGAYSYRMMFYYLSYSGEQILISLGFMITYHLFLLSKNR